MAWWSRKKPAPIEDAPVDGETLLDAPSSEESATPQVETLFEADGYAGDSTEPEPGSEREPEVEPDSEAESEAETVSEAGPDAGPESELTSSHVRGTHARRRAHGRSWRKRSSGLRADEAAKDSETESGPASTRPGSEPARKGHLHSARTPLSVALKRAVSVVLIIAALFGAVYALPLFADGINWLARWAKLRTVAPTSVSSVPAEDNLLVIGVSDGVVVGFAALKAERSTGKVLGIAIPDGAFVEVPGQGFERVGASYLGGPQVSEDAISNFFGVPFRKHVVIDGASYQALLRNQDVSGLMRAVTATDLTDDERASFTDYFASVGTKDVWIVPLPVKPVAVGDQRYFEPQKAEIADLLLKWWGVQASQIQAMPRVIVYNGVGTPGLAGVAARQLIRAGFRIVDSGNAANFEYATTEIHLFHGTQADADSVRISLGVGRIVLESAPQDLTDMIVIIGADYRPPTSDLSIVPTEGVQ
jgi:hypothetical protein